MLFWLMNTNRFLCAFLYLHSYIVFQVLVFQEELRVKRRGKIGKILYVDETYIEVKGKWCYLYRAIDRKGNLVDSMLSPKRDLEAAKAFFKQAKTITELPEKMITDGLSSYPGAIRETLGKEVKHEVRGCQGNPVEPSHCRVKQRYYPTLGFGKFECAQRFCQTVDEIAQFFRAATGNSLGVMTSLVTGNTIL
jgi:putative transposase